MPFGLCNAAQTFQPFMDKLFKHLPFVFCYLDNLIIGRQHTGEASRASPKDLHHPSGELPSRYRPHAPTPHQCTQRGPKTLVWPPVAAFLAAKAALAAAVPLAHPAPNAVVSLAVDASHTHLGGVLQQLAGGSWPSTRRSCQGRAPDTPPSTGSCWPPSAQSDTSHFCWKGDTFTCSLTTNHWSHPFSAPHRPGRPANSDRYPSSPSLIRTSDTNQAKRTWWLTPFELTATGLPTAQPTSPALPPRTGRRRAWLYRSGPFWRPPPRQRQ
jgi:hypothetical protein